MKIMPGPGSGDKTTAHQRRIDHPRSNGISAADPQRTEREDHRMNALLRSGVIAAGTFALIATSGPATAKIGSCSEPITFGTTISSTGRYSTLADKWRTMTIEFAKMINERGGIDVKSCGKKLPLQIVISRPPKL